MNDGVIVALYSPTTARLLTDFVANTPQTVSHWKAYYESLKNSQTTRDDERDLQVSSTLTLTRQVLVFEKCLFRNNAQGPDSPTAEDGIITALPNNDIVLKSCIFESNTFSQPVKGVRIVAPALYIVFQFAAAVDILISTFRMGSFSRKTAMPFLFREGKLQFLIRVLSITTL